jgi:hypothetical protein
MAARFLKKTFIIELILILWILINIYTSFALDFLFLYPSVVKIQADSAATCFVVFVRTIVLPYRNMIWPYFYCPRIWEEEEKER